MKNQKRYFVNLLICIFIFFGVAASEQTIVNFPSVSGVNSVIEKDGFVWIASTGGLFKYNLDNKTIKHFLNYEDYPDVNLTSLAYDSSGNLWVSSELGYLYRITPSGRHSIFTVYKSSSWKIKQMLFYQGYLLIASSKGFSIFDVDKKTVLQSTVEIGDFSSPSLNCVKIVQGQIRENDILINIDRLYLGMLNGVAYIDNDIDIDKINFFDASIWKTDTTTKDIKSILIYQDSIIISNTTVAVWDGDLFSMKDTEINKNNIKLNNLWSNINSIIPGEKQCWFGTEENYLHYYNGDTTEKIAFDGLSSNYINRIFVDSRKITWFVPRVEMKEGTATPRDNIKLTSYNKDNWNYYKKGVDNFGSMGDGNNFLAIAEDATGSVWAGNNGGGVRKFNNSTQKWDRYRTKGDTFELLDEDKSTPWSKTDIIISDKLGYLWFGIYSNGSNGSLLCYKPNGEEPNTGNYRYLLPEGDVSYLFNPIAMSADSAGYILAATHLHENGRVIAFNYDENPIANGVNALILDTLIDTVRTITSVSDSFSLVSSKSGLYIFKSNINQPPSFEKVSGISNLSFVTSISGTGVNSRRSFTDLNEMKIELSLWLGFRATGLKKTVLEVILNTDGSINSAQINDDSTFSYTIDNGLLSMSVNNIFYDKERGYLWVATNNGVSRIYEGTNYKAVANSKNISAYPNPFIKSKHDKITFTHLKPSSSVLVYSIDGRLVANIKDTGANGTRNRFEWTYTWVPSDNIFPGTYIYSSNDINDRRGNGIGKILILP